MHQAFHRVCVLLRATPAHHGLRYVESRKNSFFIIRKIRGKVYRFSFSAYRKELGALIGYYDTVHRHFVYLLLGFADFIIGSHEIGFRQSYLHLIERNRESINQRKCIAFNFSQDFDVFQRRNNARRSETVACVPINIDMDNIFSLKLLLLCTCKLIA